MPHQLGLPPSTSLTFASWNGCRTELAGRVSNNTFLQALYHLHLTLLKGLYHSTLVNFSTVLLHNPRHLDMLPLSVPSPSRSTRHHKFTQPFSARTERYRKSAILSMVHIINSLTHTHPPTDMYPSTHAHGCTHPVNDA